MEKEPLLPYLSPRVAQPPPPELFPVPEHDEISVSIPLCLSRSELKDRLIFGPASPSSNLQSPTFIDALALTLNSPRSTAPSFLDPKTISEKQKSFSDDPNYGCQKSSLHRSKTAPAMAVINDFVHPPDAVGKPPQFNSSSIIRQAFMLLICYLIFGVSIFWFNRDDFGGTETHPIVDALYFCIVTMCTIGYGDITPQSSVTKLFSIMFVLVGFGFIDILLSGMVSYVLDLQERYLLRSIKGGVVKDKNPNSYIIDVKKGRMRIRMKVGLALGVVVLCIGVGAVFMHSQEHLGWLDSFYLSVMSVTTVGYGDRAFSSMGGRIFASIWLLVSTLAVARAFLYLAEARVDKRQRHMAKWVLGQDMTVSQFLAADIDNNGFVSKAEYVIYKLKEMGKVSEKEIVQICQKFDRLDTGNCGKISLYDFLESHR